MKYKTDMSNNQNIILYKFFMCNFALQLLENHKQK